MSYIRKEWKTGEVITASGLNNLEEGVAEAKKAIEQAGVGVTPIEKGGTGATSAKAAEHNISGSMDESTAAIADDTPLIMKYGTPSATNGVFRHFKASLLWTWIASKIRSVFGFSSANVLPVANGGTGNTTGKAASAGSADKLATARTVRVNLGSTSAVSFDGSANIAPGVTGSLPVANGGTGAGTAAAACLSLGVEKIYYSVSDIGCSLASTMSEVWNALPSKSVLMMEIKNFTDASWGLSNLEYGFLIMRKPFTSTARGEICCVGKSGITYWMGLNGNNVPNGIWNKVVTTNGDSTINGTLTATKIIGAVYA